MTISAPFRPQPMSAGARQGCPVIDADAVEEIGEHFLPTHAPVVVRGLARRFPLTIFRWSVQHIRPLLGEQVLPVMLTDTGFLSYERRMCPMPFAEFARRSFGECAHVPGAQPRLYFRSPTSVLPAHEDDSEKITPLAPFVRRASARNLWISGPGLTVGLHYDCAENLNFQLRGTKRFTIYPPGLRGYYPMPMFSETSHISRVFRDGPAPDLDRFPRFDPTRAIDVTLQEGDLLYLPAFYWHQVDSLGAENVNLNLWWFPSVARQLRFPNHMLRAYFQLGLRRYRYGDMQKAAQPKGDA